MEGLEFYMFEDELWCKTSDGKNFIVDESHTELVKYILEKVRAYYPDAYKALEKIYAKSAPNESYYQYLMMRRFCKCNFCRLDTTAFDVVDVDKDGKFNFEKVNVQCVANVLMNVLYACQGLMLISLLLSCE